MQPHKLTVQEVFEKERRYDIPLYQRAYVWNEDEQWAPLWNDIRNQAEHYLESAGAPTSNHFLGAVVWSNNPIIGRAIAKADVIDGQQRLTTLQIFIAALGACAEGTDSSVAAKARRWTLNPDCDGDNEDLKVWPTNADREVFRSVMTANGPDDLRAQYTRGNGSGKMLLPRMAEAYLYFYDEIDAFVDEGDIEADKANRLNAISQALRSALQFVVIELEVGDDPQIIFETLNARGQPLLPSDLVRNFVFLTASRQDGSDSDALYSRYWKVFDRRSENQADSSGEDRFWHQEERQGRLKRPRIDLFLFHYLTLMTERELNIGQLFKEFRLWRNQRTDSIEEFLADLKSHSEYFAALIAPTGTDRLSTFARRLKTLDTSTVYPLLLFISSQTLQQLPDEQRDQIISDLESFLVRRLVAGLTTKNYNKFFLGLLIKVKRAAANGESVANAVRDELLRSSEKTAIWPSDGAFREAWVANPVYVKSRSDRTAMLLRAIEESIRTTRNEAISLPSGLTIEHLLPQKYTTLNYPFPADMPLKGDETPEVCRARMLHTIGNLTLLTQALNSGISNGPFADKRQQIGDDSDLRLNAVWRSDQATTWSEADIILRGEKLFEIAIEIWRRPATSHATDEVENALLRESYTGRIAALKAAGLLTDEETLTLRYRGQKFTGTLKNSGIQINEGTFSPSEAALRCYARIGSDRASVNGWRVWKTKGGESLRELLISLGDRAENAE